MRNTTTSASDAPTAARAMAAMRSKPSALCPHVSLGNGVDRRGTHMMMEGVYVVSGAQVEKTAKVET